MPSPPRSGTHFPFNGRLAEAAGSPGRPLILNGGIFNRRSATLRWIHRSVIIHETVILQSVEGCSLDGGIDRAGLALGYRFCCRRDNGELMSNG
jgi:hypothetical protein